MYQVNHTLIYKSRNKARIRIDALMVLHYLLLFRCVFNITSSLHIFLYRVIVQWVSSSICNYCLIWSYNLKIFTVCTIVNNFIFITIRAASTTFIYSSNGDEYVIITTTILYWVLSYWIRTLYLFLYRIMKLSSKTWLYPISTSFDKYALNLATIDMTRVVMQTFHFNHKKWQHNTNHSKIDAINVCIILWTDKWCNTTQDTDKTIKLVCVVYTGPLANFGRTTPTAHHAVEILLHWASDTIWLAGTSLVFDSKSNGPTNKLVRSARVIESLNRQCLDWSSEQLCLADIVFP